LPTSAAHADISTPIHQSNCTLLLACNVTPFHVMPTNWQFVAQQNLSRSSSCVMWRRPTLWWGTLTQRTLTNVHLTANLMSAFNEIWSIWRFRRGHGQVTVTFWGWRIACDDSHLFFNTLSRSGCAKFNVPTSITPFVQTTAPLHPGTSTTSDVSLCLAYTWGKGKQSGSRFLHFKQWHEVGHPLATKPGAPPRALLDSIAWDSRYRETGRPVRISSLQGD
jgi:hypothetical protein